jgi:hypothetical protein
MVLKRGMIKFLELLLVLFICIKINGQSIVITGTIKEINQQPIISASVILKDTTGKIISYTYSDEQGKYSLTINKMGVYVLSANALGFEQKRITLDCTNKQDNHVINFFLSKKDITLKEVVVESRRAITIKKDTIIFDAKSFATGNEQVVEDLLRRIPGLNILPDGTIKVGSREVEKVMIDGDDMFDRGYKILTKNMPINPIDKIEILQRFSNNQILKGIENSDRVAINLTLKQDFKRKWFGNLGLGSSFISESRHDTKGNLMNFGKRDKHYFLTNLNNIGFDATGDINHLIRSYHIDEPGNIGDDESANTYLYLGYSTPNMKQKRTNLNNSKMLSLNSILTLSEKIKLTVLGFLNDDRSFYFRNSLQLFNIGNTTFENKDNFEGIRNRNIGFSKIQLLYNISKTKTLEYTGKYSNGKELNQSNLIFNNFFLAENLNNKNERLDKKLLFSNKLNQNKALLVSARYISDRIPQVYHVNQFLFQDLFPEKADNLKQFSQNKMQYAGIEGHFFEKKKNGDLLEIKLGNQLRFDQLITRFELLKNDTILATPTNFQNTLKYLVNNAFLSFKYNLKQGNFNFRTQSEMHHIINQFIDDGIKQRQAPLFFVPKIGIDWSVNKKNKITTDYSFNTTNPGVLDIYSGYIQTDFRTFSKGISSFEQLNSSKLSINYSYGNLGEKLFSNTSIIYIINNEFLSTNNIVFPNYAVSEKIIVKGRKFLNISSNLDYYVKLIKSNFKLSVAHTYIYFKNIVNGSDLREVQNFSTEYGFEMRSGFKGIFNYHFGSKWSQNKVKSNTENYFINSMSFFDLSLNLSKKANIQLQCERYYFGSENSNTNVYYFLDLEARYVVKNNKITFFLSGNNLFNKDSFTNFSINDISISRTQFRLQPRYLLIKIEYRF